MHTRTREPQPATSSGNSAARPEPKTIRPAVAKGEGLGSHRGVRQSWTPTGNAAENFCDVRGLAIIGATASRQGGVVLGLLVSGDRVGVGIHLDQQGVRRVGLVLHDIESDHPGLGQ